MQALTAFVLTVKYLKADRLQLATVWFDEYKRRGGKHTYSWFMSKYKNMSKKSKSKKVK